MTKKERNLLTKREKTLLTKREKTLLTKRKKNNNLLTEREKTYPTDRERKYVPLLLPRWMEWPRRTLGRCEVLTLLTASGRSDQSHRLAPVSVTPYTCHHNQREGWEGKGKTTHSRKGALITARPLLVTHVSLGRHVRSTSPIFAIPPRARGRNLNYTWQSAT